MNVRSRWALAAIAAFGLGYAYWKLAIPTQRIELRSELVMLGDLDGDDRWSTADTALLEGALREPFSIPVDLACRIDLNRNSLIDSEDVAILERLVAAGGDPYLAESEARSRKQPFPRPRELYQYFSLDEYRARPLFALPYPGQADSVLDWLVSVPPPVATGSYADTLDAEIYSEAIRFDRAWRAREKGLLPLEREYAATKLARAKALFDAGEKYELLLALIELVEDAETLTVRNQPELPLKLLTLRDHLREVLASAEYAKLEAGTSDWRPVLALVSRHLKSDLGVSYDFETLGSPRNATDLESYLQRAEWQYYKSTTTEADFVALVAFAQHDPRYLRAVSRTSPKFRDPNVENHNLPMLLLFREALRIKGGDKKKAVGLLDESIRIPYAWIKSIPRDVLPGSVALDNFLLPGNKEDGADKSRHWNVFGGIALYKSPQEALDLALKREMTDLREADYSGKAMEEFLRDMIANLNGMYHVMTVDPKLLDSTRQ